MSGDEAGGERHYRERVNLIKFRGLESLGLATSWAWHDDPRHLLFTFARYKFVSKILEGSSRVLEIGCGDGFPTRLVAQSVGSVLATDFDLEFVTDAESRPSDKWPVEFRKHDWLSSPIQDAFDGAYALDVLEHIPAHLEDRFLENIAESLNSSGVLVIGTPSVESQVYASPQSKEGHVNCKSGDELKSLMQRHFQNVFLFSMNDEVVHTGYSRMAHYLFAVCCSPRTFSAR